MHSSRRLEDLDQMQGGKICLSVGWGVGWRGQGGRAGEEELREKRM